MTTHPFSRLLLLPLLCAFCQSAACRESLEIDDLHKALTPEDISKLTVIFERLLAFHTTHLKLETPLRFPVRVFESKEQYRQYQKKISTTARSGSGFYSSSRKEMVIYKNARYFNTTVHEGQHLILRSKLRNPPKWLNEGLSEFYEEAFLEGEQVFVKAQSGKSQRLRQWKKEGSLPALSAFLALDNDEWKARNIKPDNRSSTVSWGLVYFLMSTEDGRTILSRTIRDLAKDQKEDASTILGGHYSGGIATLERDFHLFLAQIPPRQEI